MYSKSNQQISNPLVIGLVIAAALVRLLPHPWNFVPTTALAIFSGAQFPTLASAVAVMFTSMVLSDLVLGFHVTQPFVYGALFLIMLASRSLKKHKGAAPLLGVTLTSSIFFFLVTNLGVFLLQSLYPKTIAGLLECYLAALPFFQNSLLSDVLYVVILFGAYEALGQKRQTASHAAA